MIVTDTLWSDTPTNIYSNLGLLVLNHLRYLKIFDL